MKLIYCKSCNDVVTLRSSHRRTCECGRSWGRYTTLTNAYCGGDAVPLGLIPKSLWRAINAQPETGMGKEFLTFVIPKQCPTFGKERST